MKARDIFEIAIRVVGLIAIVAGIFFLVDLLSIQIAISKNEVYVAGSVRQDFTTTHLLFQIFASFFVGLAFLFRAGSIGRFFYPDEKTDTKSDA